MWRAAPASHLQRGVEHHQLGAGGDDVVALVALHEAHVDVSLRRLGRCRDTDLRSASEQGAPLYTPDIHTCGLTSLPAESQRESALLALQIIITALKEKT